MTPEMNWNNIHIAHNKPIISFDVSEDEILHIAFIGKNMQALLKIDNIEKRRKFDLLDYR